MRFGPVPNVFPDYRLETVARAVLGEGKSVSFADGAGEEKIALLDRLYETDRDAFAEYCRNDAVLVVRILEKTGLLRLAVERAGAYGRFPWIRPGPAWRVSSASMRRSFASAA